MTKQEEFVIELEKTFNLAKELKLRNPSFCTVTYLEELKQLIETAKKELKINEKLA